MIASFVCVLCQHANARGSGGMPPGKFFNNRCCEIESEGILESKYHIMYINFKSQNICEIKTSAINMICDWIYEN